MGYFVNSLKHSDSLSRDIKELIPEMNIRRRMSRVVKMGVCCALESLIDFEEGANRDVTVDAIVTATSLGAIADSERFLANIITSDERMLNPTPFIQSTFNTVGAQIALIRKMQCYNNTFVQRNNSFESGLLEATLRLKCGVSKGVLVGVFDESTPTVEMILSRLGILGDRGVGEGAIFFVLTAQRYTTSVAEIEISLESSDEELTDCDALSVANSGTEYWSGAMAQLMQRAIEEGRSVRLANNWSRAMRAMIDLRVL